MTTPWETTVSLGYRKDDRNFRRGLDLTAPVKFLGLIPEGRRIGVGDYFKR